MVNEVAKEVLEHGFNGAINKQTNTIRCVLDQLNELEGNVITYELCSSDEEIDKSIKDIIKEIEDMRKEVLGIAKDLDNI